MTHSIKMFLLFCACTPQMALSMQSSLAEIAAQKASIQEKLDNLDKRIVYNRKLLASCPEKDKEQLSTLINDWEQQYKSLCNDLLNLSAPSKTE